MASSGRVDTGYLKNSRFYVTWSSSSPNIPENYHDVTWKAGLNNGNYWYTNAIRINYVDINGTRVSNGGTWSNITTKGDVELLNGTVRIYHNGDGSKEFNISISGWLYSYGDTTGSQNFTLDTIPRQANVTNATDFNDEQNPTIWFNNAGGFPINARLEFGGTQIQRNNIANTGSYTFNLTDSERDLLREKCTSNSMIVRMVIATRIGSETENYWSWQDKTMTIINANPIINNITYKDNKAETVSITQNNQIIIRNNSELLFTIANATALKGSSIALSQITIAGETKTVVAGDNNWGILNQSSNVTAVLKITDSRGNYATKNINITVEDWVLPTAIIDLKRKNNFYSETYIKADANYSSINNKNTVNIKCRYKKVTEEIYSEYVLLNDNVQSTIELDNNFKWDVQVVVTDRIGNTTYNLYLDRGMPIIFFDRNINSVGVNGFPTHSNSFEVFGDMYINGNKLN